MEQLSDHFDPGKRHRHCEHQAAHSIAPPDEPCVYFVGGYIGHIKIGFATSVVQRVSDLQVGNPAELFLYAWWPGGRADEAALHSHFALDRVRGEWFERTPRLLRTIKSLQRRAARQQGIRLPDAEIWTDDD